MDRRKGRKGFTLVEVIVVLVILAILAAILIPTYIGYIEKTKKTRCAVQRGELEKKFVAMYAYDSDLRKCTTTADVEQLLGTTNVAQYMLDNGYYEGQTQCPVYEQDYSFSLVASGAGYRGEFTCGCTGSEFDKFAEAAKTALAALKKSNPNYQSDQELIKRTYDEYGSLLKVSDDDMERAGLSGTMYWRPYQVANGTIIYFASTKAYSASNPHGQWNAAIIKVDGTIYATSSSAGESIAGANDYKSKDIQEFINSYLPSKGFTKK